MTIDRPAHRLRPIPALDGVRGLAVAAVVLFHFPTTSVVPGGMFGVDVFFVLSGFLVTAGLMDSAEASGAAPIRDFLARRACRLVPALVAFLAVVLLLAVFFRRDPWFTSDPFGRPGSPVSMIEVLKGAGGGLLYIYNFFVINGWHNAMPFSHLWTLAIEGQFYVSWALLLRWLLRRHSYWMLPVTVSVIAVSAVVPWLVWHGGTGYAQNVIYFGTLPRLQQLMSGAALAQIWTQGWLDQLPGPLLRLAATAGGVSLLYMCLRVGDSSFKYLGAETATAAAAVALVAYLVGGPDGSPSARALASAPLRWLGTRSYAIYLWHWPFAVWTNQQPNDWGVPLGISASLLAAELSRRLVEQPAQRRARLRRRVGADRQAVDLPPGSSRMTVEDHAVVNGK